MSDAARIQHQHACHAYNALRRDSMTQPLTRDGFMLRYVGRFLLSRAGA